MSVIKKTTIICDRCGKEIPNGSNKSISYLTTICFGKVLLWETGIKWRDLCDECAHKFRKWMRCEEEFKDEQDNISKEQQ